MADYPSMALGFNVVRKLEDGEVLAITWRERLSEAEGIVRELAECWPGEYLIEEATGAPGPWVPYVFAGSSWPN